MQPLGGNFAASVVVEISNFYLQAVQSIRPHAIGWCILVRREIHAAMGGFDERLKLAEDHDYVQRAARHGRFKVFTHIRIPVYNRRFDTDGFFPFVLKVLWTEIFVMAGKTMYSAPFGFVYSQHKPPASAPVLSRRRVGRSMLWAPFVSLGNSLKRLGAVGLSPSSSWTQPDWWGESHKKGLRLWGWIRTHLTRNISWKKKQKD
jgi:hypothetical protein